MITVWMLGMAACVWETGSADWDSGAEQQDTTARCDESSDCPAGSTCQVGACSCVLDADCPDAFACGEPHYAWTDPTGCVERCQIDDECKAGFQCSEAGECLEAG